MPQENATGEPRRKLPSLPWGSILLFFLFGGLIAAGFYHRCPPWRDTIVFVGSVLGGTAGLYSLLLAVEQYEASVAQHRSGVEQNKRQMAHHLIERWNNPQMEEQKNVLRAVRWEGLDPRDFAHPVTDRFLGFTEKEKREWRDTRSKIVAILSFCEEIALAVNAGSLREDLMRRSINHLLIDTFVDLMPWIEKENQKKGEDPTTTPLRIYNEMETLALRWAGDSTRAKLKARVQKEREQAAQASRNN